MDRRIVIAFVISFLIIFTYPYYLKMLTKSTNEILLEEDYEDQAVITQVQTDITLSNGLKVIPQKEEIFTLENKSLILTITNSGAAIRSILLKDYAINHTEDSLFPLFNSPKDEKGDLIGALRIGIEDGDIINDFKSINYSKIDTVVDNKIIFESPIINGLQIVKSYSLKENEYVINVETQIKNIEDTQRSINIEFCSALDYKIKNRYDQHFVNSVINSYNKLISTKLNKINKDGFAFQEKVNWLALEDKYFSVILKPDFIVNETRIIGVNDFRLIGYIQSDNFNIMPKETILKNAFIYAGPKEHKILKTYNQGFENLLSRGFFGGLKILLLIILNFFYKICHNYGLSIIILTVIIKVLFTPLTHKSFESMRKMQELQPQMKELQEKYKNNPQQLNRAVMELYKKHKANPFGGCLPILFQMPIFIALYQTLSRSVELRGAHFIWWIKDLSEPDKMFNFPFNIPVIGDSFNLLPLMMMGSMIWQQKLTPSASTKEQERIMLIMPIIFGIMFYSLPSGLVLYWLVNNILTIAHQLLMRKIK